MSIVRLWKMEHTWGCQTEVSIAQRYFSAISRFVVELANDLLLARRKEGAGSRLLADENIWRARKADRTKPGKALFCTILDREFDDVLISFCSVWKRARFHDNIDVRNSLSLSFTFHKECIDVDGDRRHAARVEVGPCLLNVGELDGASEPDRVGRSR